MIGYHLIVDHSSTRGRWLAIDETPPTITHRIASRLLSFWQTLLRPTCTYLLYYTSSPLTQNNIMVSFSLTAQYAHKREICYAAQRRTRRQLQNLLLVWGVGCRYIILLSHRPTPVKKTKTIPLSPNNTINLKKLTMRQ